MLENGGYAGRCAQDKPLGFSGRLEPGWPLIDHVETNPMHIDTATLADIPALCELLAALFSQEAEFTPDAAAQAKGLGRIIADPNIGAIVVARDEGVVVGMANLLYTVSTAVGERVALLEDMVVSSPARGAGVGSQILAHAIVVARASGCQRITLLTDHTNDAAQRFYRKQGFKASAMVPMRLTLGESDEPS